MTCAFSFGGVRSAVIIQEKLPSLKEIFAQFDSPPAGALIVADANTAPFARRVDGEERCALCVLDAGEASKNWQSVETALDAARKAGLGRDALFIGIGGGVVTDVAGFAASVFMRGVRLAFVSTTLLGMTDAALGGKTGIDLFGIKNLAGTFYPAQAVFMSMEALVTLPEAEFKSGFAEIIKTAILDVESEDDAAFAAIRRAITERSGAALEALTGMAVRVKGRVVEADPRETGSERALLNLGHSFGHALESAAGLGTVSHGEAVAWGIARACELGRLRGITPPERAEKITALLGDAGYEIRAPHPALSNKNDFCAALASDKKNTGAQFRFIVPAQRGAVIVTLERHEEKTIHSICGIA